MGKALHSMWILINTLQFFVYISAWRIMYPSFTQMLLHQFKRIALGEFMDDLDWADQVSEELKIPTDEEQSELLSGLGLTLILASATLLILVILVLIINLVLKGCKLSPKWQSRLKWLKQKVFWNPLIRYTLLNTLKLNMIAMIFFIKGKEIDSGSGYQSIGLLTLLLFLPLFYSCVLACK